MKPAEYRKVKDNIIERGYGDEIKWCEERKPCTEPADFFLEYTWVVVNSGMKEQVARKIYENILRAISVHEPVDTAFGHRGKANAISQMLLAYNGCFQDFQRSEDKVEYLASLPWIGKITKYHLARNLGLDVCKPDRHLVRIAAKYNTTPDELCRRLSKETGDRIGTVDVVLWRAANLGLI